MQRPKKEKEWTGSVYASFSCRGKTCLPPGLLSSVSAPAALCQALFFCSCRSAAEFDSETLGAISDLPSLESEAYFFPCRVRPSHL